MQLQPEARADGRGRHAVLAGAGLGDDALLAETAGDHRLTERVVHLVRTGVEQVLALQVQATVRREPCGASQRRRPARVVRQQLVQLGAEAVVVAQRAPHRRQLVERRDQRLGNVAAAVGTERRAHRAALHPVAHGGVILDARRRTRSSARSRPPRADCGDRLADVRRPEAAGEHHAALASTWPARGASGRPRPRADRRRCRSRSPSRSKRRVARAMAVLALVQLHQIGIGLVQLRRRRPRRAAPVSGASSSSDRSSRALVGEDEADHVGAGVDRHVDVVLAREAADLDERPRHELLSLAPGSAARISVEPTSIACGARKLRLGGLCARLDRALGDQDAIARSLGRAARSARAGRCGRSRDRGR